MAEYRTHGAWEERLLGQAAAAVAYPATPDVRSAVLATLAVFPERRAATPLRLRLAAAALAALALLVAFVVAMEPARTAVAEFFGLVPGSRLEFIPGPVAPPPAGHETGQPGAPAGLPTEAAPTALATALPTPIPLPQYGIAVTLEDARERLGWEPALPSTAGEPEGIYLVLWGSQPVLILQYATFDLWQMRRGDFIGKGLPSGAVVEVAHVHDNPAYWIVSSDYELRFLDAEGRELLGSRRTVDRNALIWNGAETFYRMETELPLEEALAIAESLP